MRPLKLRKTAALLAVGMFVLSSIFCPEVRAQAPARPESGFADQVHPKILHKGRM